MGTVLTDEQLASYWRDGFIHLGQAFPRWLAKQCCDLLWEQIEERRDIPATWARPVVRIGSFADDSFRLAAQSPRWTGAINDVAGPEAAPTPWLHGSFVVRFPVEVDPSDHAWHVEGSYVGPDGSWWVNHRSEGRALLMLALFSDIGADDAPTRIRAGSHREIPKMLLPYGEKGVSSMEFEPPARIHELPLVFATGEAGDAYLCHPFLVHAAQRHQGSNPRFLAQLNVPWKGVSSGLPPIY